MTSAKFYRRIILACLWFLFLAVVYGKNRQTREEHEAEQAAELTARLLHDEEYQAIIREMEEREKDPEHQYLKSILRERDLEAMINNALEDSE